MTWTDNARCVVVIFINDEYSLPSRWPGDGSTGLGHVEQITKSPAWHVISCGF
ncbi:MAG: hypothetical protein O7B25_08305 [Gammaproteobacteria bacterium]|nr:hypothetical protein [Gammaproteobacteria bacterium]